MAPPIVAADLRTYMAQTASTGLWSDANLTAAIASAFARLQRETRRTFEPASAQTINVTTRGSTLVQIPDSRAVTSATLSGTLLVNGTGYIAEADPSGVSTALTRLRFAAASGYRYGWYPNNLALVLDTGYSPYPPELMNATKVLSGFTAMRPETVLAGTAFTPDGTVLSYQSLPEEVRAFIEEWRRFEVAF